MSTLTMPTLSLYERLGKRERIEAIVEDIVAAHMSNPLIKARFLPYLEQGEKLAHTKSLLVEFLCAGSGGSEAYTGRDMQATHRGMNISEAEYMAAIDDIMQVLSSHNIDEETQKDILFIGYSLRKQIIAQ